MNKTDATIKFNVRPVNKKLTIRSIESWNAFGAPNRSITALKVPRPAVEVDLAHHVCSWAAAIRGNAAIRKWVVPLNGIFQYVEILARGTPTNAAPIPKLSLCPMKQKHTHKIQLQYCNSYLKRNHHARSQS